MAAAFPARNASAHCNKYIVRLLGTGASDPTIDGGPNIKSAARQSAGVYRIQFQQDPGKYLGTVGWCFDAATPGNVKGYTAVITSYDATNLRADVNVFNSTFTATDLAAAQYLTLELAFSEHGN